MKKVMIMLMVFATFAVSAQKMDRTKDAKTNYTAAQKIDLKTKQMTLELGLNSSQQEKVKAVMTEMSKTAPAKTENRQAKTSDEKYAIKSARMDRKIEFKNKLKDILTPEQMTKWEQKRSSKPHTNRKRLNSRQKSAE